MRKGTFDNIKSKTCIYCNLKFENIKNSVFSNHVRWCSKNPKLNLKKESDNGKLAAKISNQIYGIKQYRIVQCIRCEKFFVVENTLYTHNKKKYFCTKTCSNTRIHSLETKNKIKNCVCKNHLSLSENTKRLWKNEEWSKKVLNTNKYFTSKGERILRNYFISNYSHEGWTFGGHLVFNGLGISRDLYSPLLKICIEYDGIWHFEDICGQLTSKQEKDAALEQWCLINSYRLIRIKEDIFLKDIELWINNIRKEIENSASDIVKFY